MGGLVKGLVALAVVGVLAVGAGVGLALLSSGPSTTFTNTALVPFDTSVLNTPSASDQPSPSPITLAASVSLPVPFTDQAPLGDWSAKQHTCEEASLTMVDRYLRGDHSGGQIDAQTANAEINQITSWKPALDLTDVELGQLAKEYLGWAYQILPATRYNIKAQLTLGRPVIVGVRTHGLGNPTYPGYRDHYEQPGWSVSHYLVVAGYDTSDQLILNDPGLTRGHGYKISYDQLIFAINDLDNAYPDLNQGQIILVLAPLAGA